MPVLLLFGHFIDLLGFRQEAASAPASASHPPLNPKNPRRIIVSTGDISDVDGFIACAEYAKTGADLLYIMNYPAYVGVDPGAVDDDSLYEEMYPGLGYKYSSKELLGQLDQSHGAHAAVVDFLQEYDSHHNDNERVKAALTDFAFYVMHKVWSEAIAPDKGGNLFFYIGGINAVNPFSLDCVKFDLMTFSNFLPAMCRKLAATAGAVYDKVGGVVDFDLGQYQEIYLDFNGSMAFLGPESCLYTQLRAAMASKKCKGVFIAGGLQEGEPPKTMPPRSGQLNRLVCATMNQLYHPENAARLFELAAAYGIPCFTVTNNVVANLVDSDAGRTHDAVRRFLKSNGFCGGFLEALAEAYYLPAHGRPPPCKVYDYYTALVLVAAMSSNLAHIPVQARNAFYSASHGVLIVSAHSTWAEAFQAFAQTLRGCASGNQGAERLFSTDLAVLERLPALRCIPVSDVTYAIDRLLA